MSHFEELDKWKALLYKDIRPVLILKSTRIVWKIKAPTMITHDVQAKQFLMSNVF